MAKSHFKPEPLSEVLNIANLQPPPRTVGFDPTQNLSSIFVKEDLQQC